MEIKAIRTKITVVIREGIQFDANGWAVAIDGEIIADENGAIYASTNRSDIEREIRRLRAIIANQIRYDQQEEA